MSGHPQEAATPVEVPSLESLAHALFDAFYSQFDIAPPGWEPLSTIGGGWLAVARVASDGATIAAKAVTDALAAENERLRAALEEARETLQRIALGTAGPPHVSSVAAEKAAVKLREALEARDGA